MSHYGENNITKKVDLQIYFFSFLDQQFHTVGRCDIFDLSKLFLSACLPLDSEVQLHHILVSSVPVVHLLPFLIQLYLWFFLNCLLMRNLALLSYLFRCPTCRRFSCFYLVTGKQQKITTVAALLSPHHWSVPTPPSYSSSSYWPFPQLMRCYLVQTDSLYGAPEEVIAIFWKFPISLTVVWIFARQPPLLLNEKMLFWESLWISAAEASRLKKKKQLISELSRTKLTTVL